MPDGRRLLHFSQLTFVAKVRFLHIYFAFAAGYLLSYLFRSVNAIISPELARDLSLNPASLGLLTSAYFLAFATMQIPVGILLDRYGPRRVEPVLLTLAAAGAALFAAAESLPALAVARAGDRRRRKRVPDGAAEGAGHVVPAGPAGLLLGLIMVAGGIGALLATVPVELALRVTGWRSIFVVLAVVTLVVAALIWWRVPDIPKSEKGETLAAQLAGVRSVFVHPRFWWIAPLASFGMGSFMAIQGLWAVPWIIDVDGGTRAVAANHLFVMNGVIIAGVSGTWLVRPAAGSPRRACPPSVRRRLRAQRRGTRDDRRAGARQLRVVVAPGTGCSGQHPRVHRAQ